MFTGIIEAVGTVSSCKKSAGDMLLTVETGSLDMSDVVPGDSIAVNGVCLTAVKLEDNRFQADVSAETLAHTTLGSFEAGRRVNLEKALTPSSRLGGHLVSGHVDGVGKVLDRKSVGNSERFRLQSPPELSRYIARKGSICVDGISLTVNSVNGTEFDLNIVPHTLANTVMNDYQAGSLVNLEVDIIARYIERMLIGDKNDAKQSLSMETLRQNGFIG